MYKVLNQKNMKTKLTTLLVLFISTQLFAQDELKTLEQDNYSISYPEEWISSDQKPQPTIQFMLLSDESSQKKDKFRENINLNTEDLGEQTVTLEEYSKISINQIKTQIPGVKIVATETIKLDGNDATELIWQADFGNGMELKFKQLFIISNAKAYILTFSSTTTEFDEYSEIADTILQSFKLTK